ncbi:hypothetical protein CLV88_101508 [Shimia abyssi]|uniref:Uncharacterized protein n=1 Tax=Shimia abyssi TaxID=1662395 RepID=A0A2P8FK33_9RHOB|nr:hypothetical protein CLV88_101508 [Shimia abyssi]
MYGYSFRQPNVVSPGTVHGTEPYVLGKGGGKNLPSFFFRVGVS